VAAVKRGYWLQEFEVKERLELLIRSLHHPTQHNFRDVEEYWVIRHEPIIGTDAV
jgi:alpha-D-ribose 1-methylphosphonate 5-triphosphate diphosphatase PhnM